MTHGDVYWYTFKDPDKRRPVLILTRNSAIPFLTSLTIAPITSTIRSIPTEVVLSQADGLFTDCAVNLDNIQTVHESKNRWIHWASFNETYARGTQSY